MIILGRDRRPNGSPALDASQQLDLEIIKRKYANMIDILTYDADYDEAAQVNQYDGAQDSWMMPPTRNGIMPPGCEGLLWQISLWHQRRPSVNPFEAF
jgi:hypothetical protein